MSLFKRENPRCPHTIYHFEQIEYNDFSSSLVGEGFCIRCDSYVKIYHPMSSVNIVHQYISKQSAEIEKLKIQLIFANHELSLKRRKK